MNSFVEEHLQGFSSSFGRPNSIREANLQEICCLETLKRNCVNLLCEDNLIEMTLWGFMDNLSVIPTPRVLSKCLVLFLCIYLLTFNHVYMHMFIQFSHCTFLQTKQKKVK